jgi:AcrR family transcriptional regulator
MTTVKNQKKTLMDVADDTQPTSRATSKVGLRMQRINTAKIRKSLLRAASELFVERGFRDATIAQISQRAETNVAAVNYHFGDKEALYREAWRSSLRESIKAYPPDGGVSLSAIPEERLAGQVSAFLRRVNDEHNREVRISLQEMANPTGLLDEVIQEEIQPLLQRLTELVHEIIGQDRSEREVLFCVLSIWGLCVIPTFLNMVKISGNESLRIDDIEAYARHVIAFSLAGMRAICSK